MTRQVHILVVDDDPIVIRVLRLKLTRAGFAVSVAFSGHEAWKLLQEKPADLLILDEQMPGMNGSELCRRIREDARLSELPILMITGKMLEVDQERLREQFRLIDIIGKPFSCRAVLRCVTTHLDGRLAECGDSRCVCCAG